MRQQLVRRIEPRRKPLRRLQRQQGLRYRARYRMMVAGVQLARATSAYSDDAGVICLNGGLRLPLSPFAIRATAGQVARGDTADVVGFNRHPAPNLCLPAPGISPATRRALVPAISNEIRIEPLGLGKF